MITMPMYIRIFFVAYVAMIQLNASTFEKVLSSNKTAVAIYTLVLAEVVLFMYCTHAPQGTQENIAPVCEGAELRNSSITREKIAKLAAIYYRGLAT